MASAFLVLWSSDRVRELRASNWLHRPIPYLFGGPHISHPLPSRYGVGPGDRVFPVSVTGGRIMVLCEATVEQVLPIHEFETRFGVPSYASFQSENLHKWLATQGCGWLSLTCTEEALLVSSTPVAVDRFIPASRNPDLRFINKKGLRSMSGLAADGRLKAVSPLQGHYFRLAPETADLMSRVTRGEDVGLLDLTPRTTA